LVDRIEFKRGLIATGVITLAIRALLIAVFPSCWSVATAQVLIGSMSSFFIPAIAAISLGIVRPKLFDRRPRRKPDLQLGRRVVAAIVVGLIGFFISNRSVFFSVAMLTIATILSLLVINPAEIDYEWARGAKDGADNRAPAKIRDLPSDRRLLIFLCCAVMFHFANAAMLPLLGEMLAKGRRRASMMFLSACVVTTQFTITLLA
jgi:predicted MFS family arabinose efflux permease